MDGDGAYVGVCVKSDLLRPPRMKLILIDHNETSQAISGLDESELLEVLDHHRLANPPTHMPIAFHVDPVGSSSTLVTERAMRSGLAVPRSIAGALLSGLLSDTLVLKSPTTTARDRVAAVQLSTWAFPDQADPYKAMLDYGWQLLQVGAGLEARTTESIVSGDYKEYDAAGLHFGVAQVEVTDMLEIDSRLDELRTALCGLEKNRNLHFCALMVTDIVGGTSRLLTCGDSHFLDGLPYARRADGTFEMPGIVSRKKQLLPADPQRVAVVTWQVIEFSIRRKRSQICHPYTKPYWKQNAADSPPRWPRSFMRGAASPGTKRARCSSLPTGASSARWAAASWRTAPSKRPSRSRARARRVSSRTRSWTLRAVTRACAAAKWRSLSSRSRRRPTLLIIGAGHVGRALAHLAKWMGYRVVVTDDRAELCTREFIPDADEFVVGPMQGGAGQASRGPSDLRGLRHTRLPV